MSSFISSNNNPINCQYSLREKAISHALKDATNYNSSCLHKKLKFSGTRGVLDNFLRSYILELFQYVSLVNSTSFVNNVITRIGLDPILFNLYINDIVNVSDNLKCMLFADNSHDTHILYNSKEFENVENTVNIEMSKINKWLNK